MGVFDALPASLYRRALYEDRLVLRARRPSRRRRPGPDGYLALRHIAVTISGVGASPVDAALSARGLTRRVRWRVPSLPGRRRHDDGDSDMALTLPGRLARRLAATLALQVVDLPLPMPPLSPAMIWHERFQDDPAHARLRGQIVELRRRRPAIEARRQPAILIPNLEPAGPEATPPCMTPISLLDFLRLRLRSLHAHGPLHAPRTCSWRARRKKPTPPAT